MRGKKTTGVILTAAAVLGVLGLSGPAFASEGDAPPTEPSAELMIKVGDAEPEPFVLDDLLTAPTAGEGNPEDGVVVPYLIDNSAAWIACFGPLLDPDFSLQSYTTNGWGELGEFTVDLTCGNSGTKSSGWHHIQDRHQAQWQARLDDANAEGAGPAATWDDLMAMVTGTVLADPWWFTQEYDGKRCFTQEVLVYRKDDGAEIFRAWPSVVVSMSSRQVITSYASKSIDCTRFAPWA